MAQIVASGDTLSGFLRDFQARYPETSGVLPDSAARQGADAPKAAKPDPEPTGSIPRHTLRRVSAR